MSYKSKINTLDYIGKCISYKIIPTNKELTRLRAKLESSSIVSFWIFPGIEPGDERMRGRRSGKQVDTTCALTRLATTLLEWTRADSAVAKRIAKRSFVFGVVCSRRDDQNK